MLALHPLTQPPTHLQHTANPRSIGPLYPRPKPDDLWQALAARDHRNCMSYHPDPLSSTPDTPVFASVNSPSLAHPFSFSHTSTTPLPPTDLYILPRAAAVLSQGGLDASSLHSMCGFEVSDESIVFRWYRDCTRFSGHWPFFEPECRFSHLQTRKARSLACAMHHANSPPFAWWEKRLA
jgi:hypothetical protein